MRTCFKVVETLAADSLLIRRPKIAGFVGSIAQEILLCVIMRRIFLVLVVLCFASMGQSQTCGNEVQGGQVVNCCLDCTCTLCQNIACCGSPTWDPSQCSGGGTDSCGIDLATTCSFFWSNNTEGVVTDESVTTYGPGGCIPIDGGLAFLIAGGLGIGVIGIRRRKEEVELQRA